ncbi:pseudouridine synthase pus4 [Paecilomyces lecythidis]
MSDEKIYEGVFAVHKPQGVTSADVIRKLQQHFNPSATFQPWIEAERARRKRENDFQRRRRRNQRVDVKIGHGGTLDPLATGVLITGIGKGTKQLQGFLGCTKTYETVVLFGAETDTYDSVGKVVRRCPYEHITREVVEKALEKFRGPIMQRPPIFSALKVQGKKLYEYAREGREPPIEIKARPVEVSNLEILEWYESGTHEWKFPEEEMTGEEKAVAQKMLEKDAEVPVASAEEAEEAKHTEEASSAKRKSPPAVTPSGDNAEAQNGAETEPSSKKQKTSTEGESTTVETQTSEKTENTAEDETPAATSESSKPSAGPPAVKITMTVSSGFYVRSLAHDLGKAVGSCALMTSLVRTRQGDFTLDPKNIVEYKDLDAGEDVWSPKVKRLLDEWEQKKQAEEKSK